MVLAPLLAAMVAVSAPVQVAWAQSESSGARPASAFAEMIATVAESARPSVVHIEISGMMMQQAPKIGPFGMFQPGSENPMVPFSALGSGILIDPAGYIITNNHIVENADTVYVQFFDGSEQAARIVGKDSFTDLAVIKVDRVEGMQAARFGDSESLRVGDWVVAIGSPSGLDWTVTAGIVSAKHRSNLEGWPPAGFEDFIQTDAPINPGNSGGPLLDLDGRVVGINSMIYSYSQGSEGIGFAIPSALVKSIAASIIDSGKVVRGDLGIYFKDLTMSTARDLKLPAGTHGALVSEVLPEGPAALAGMKAGDIIQAVDEFVVPSSLMLQKAVSAAKPGQAMSLDVLRQGGSLRLEARIEDQAVLLARAAERPSLFILGIKVENLDATTATRLGIERVSGVVVTDVLEGSPANNAHLDVDDVILGIGNVEVTDTEEFVSHLNEALKAPTLVLLLRDNSTGRTGFLSVKIR